MAGTSAISAEEADASLQVDSAASRLNLYQGMMADIFTQAHDFYTGGVYRRLTESDGRQAPPTYSATWKIANPHPETGTEELKVCHSADPLMHIEHIVVTDPNQGIQDQLRYHFGTNGDGEDSTDELIFIRSRLASGSPKGEFMESLRMDSAHPDRIVIRRLAGTAMAETDYVWDETQGAFVMDRTVPIGYVDQPALTHIIAASPLVLDPAAYLARKREQLVSE